MLCCLILNVVTEPWLVWLSGLSAGLQIKGCRFNSQSGHMPGCGPGPHLWACKRGNHLMFLSQINVSLPLSSSLPFSLKIK